MSRAITKLEKLIAELCPDGVEFKELGELLDYQQPTKFIVKSTEYSNSFNTPVLTAGKTFILGMTNETDNIFPASQDNPVIIFDDFTTANHWVDFPFKIKSSAIKILKIKSNDAIFRYIYFAIKNINFQPGEHSRHWISKYSKIKIPVPPLEVQEEIVRILDKFTQLEAELEAELEARKKQYSHYRNALLSFENPEDAVGVRWTTLGEICEYSKDRTSFEYLNYENYVGVESLLKDKMGRTSSISVPLSGNWTKFSKNDVLIGNIRPYLKKIWFSDTEGGANGDVLVIRSKSKEIEPRFIFHVLSSDIFFDFMNGTAKGGKMPRGDKKLIMKFKIPIFSLEKQKEIVEILDRFESLTNDISKGLPAEIAARRKQYEYYRNKLLTFNELP